MTPREAMAAMPAMPPCYAVYCEMIDVAKRATIAQALSAPRTTALALAALLTQLDTVINDESRAELIYLGGFCIRLADELDRPVQEIPTNG